MEQAAEEGEKLGDIVPDDRIVRSSWLEKQAARSRVRDQLTDRHRLTGLRDGKNDGLSCAKHALATTKTSGSGLRWLLWADRNRNISLWR